MSDQIQKTREYVQQLFAELGPHDDANLCETVLIRDSQYCGHRFRSGQLMAVWFMEEDEIKLYDQDQLVRVEPASPRRQLRRAA